MFRALSLAMLAGAVGCSLHWLTSRWYPSGYDEITHLQHSLEVYELVARDGLAGAWEAWNGRFPSEERRAYWPGAPWLLTAPVWALWRAPEAPLVGALLAALAWLLGVSMGARQLGARPGVGSWLALLPAVTVVGFRHVTPDLFVAAAAVLSAALMVRSEGLRDPAGAVAWGLVATFGMMSDRLTFAVVAGLQLVGVRSVRGVALAALPLLAAVPFYMGWWPSYGHGLVVDQARGPWTTAVRLVELAAWLPLVGLGLPATVAFLRGLGGARGDASARLVWAAAALGPLVLLGRTESGQDALVLLWIGPLAVLAAPGWRDEDGLLATLLTAAALGVHAVNAELVTTPWVETLPERGMPPDADWDGPVLDWVADHDEVVVLDLLQAKGAWAGHWLYYRLDVEGVEVQWPARRVWTEYEEADWAAEPCVDGVLVLHGDGDWHEGAGVPLGFMGLDDEQLARWEAAFDAARSCLRIDKVRAGPMIGNVTWLSRPPEPVVEEPVRTTCPEEMAHVPARRVLVGRGPRFPEMAYAVEARAVEVEGFCMDRLEAHGDDQLPLVRVTWTEARDACAARGARLCRDLEWASACRGETGRRWSYGDTYDEARCYTSGAPDFTPAARRPVGSHPDCVTAEGIHDLNGSVSEWTADSHPGPPFPDDGGPEGRRYRVIRGDTMWSAAYGQDCLSRHWHAEDQREADDGFRCCADPT